MEQEEISELWESTKVYKDFWGSFWTMITHPVKSMKLINFAAHILVMNHISIED